MTTAADLRALAKRVCEEAPSRELDSAIGAALRPGWEPHPLAPGSIREVWVGINTAPKATGCPRYTTSLDAAASLMPAGWSGILDWGGGPSRGYFVCIARDDGGPMVRIRAPTEPQARTAAALLAMAADMEDQGETR